jgi:two-component system response regulator GlrR
VVLVAAGLGDVRAKEELFGAVEPSSPLVSGTSVGALERAAGGSLLVHRVDLLTDAARASLAEVLREGSYRRVGSVDGEAILVRARVLATSEHSDANLLRGLSTQIVELAPLSERTEDVLPLSAHFLAEVSRENAVTPVGFTTEARRLLLEESWLANVRELRQRIRLAAQLAGGGAISAEALMLSTEGDEVPSFKEAKRAFETRYVEGLLRRCSGNISRAARLARKDRKDFYDVIRRTGVDPSDFRP